MSSLLFHTICPEVYILSNKIVFALKLRRMSTKHFIVARANSTEVQKSTPKNYQCMKFIYKIFVLYILNDIKFNVTVDFYISQFVQRNPSFDTIRTECNALYYC